MHDHHLFFNRDSPPPPLSQGQVPLTLELKTLRPHKGTSVANPILIKGDHCFMCLIIRYTVKDVHQTNLFVFRDSRLVAELSMSFTEAVMNGNLPDL